MQRGQNSRTAGAVSYGGGFFGLVNIMQPQNCTTRLRRLVWTSFFLWVVFLLHLFFIFYHLGYRLREKCIFSVAFKYNKLCVSSALFGEWFPSFHFELCANLPPGRHTMIPYCNIMRNEPQCKVFFCNIWTRVWSSTDTHVARIFSEPSDYTAPRRSYKFSRTYNTHTHAFCYFN